MFQQPDFHSGVCKRNDARTREKASRSPRISNTRGIREPLESPRNDSFEPSPSSSHRLGLAAIGNRDLPEALSSLSTHRSRCGGLASAPPRLRSLIIPAAGEGTVDPLTALARLRLSNYTSPRPRAACVCYREQGHETRAGEKFALSVCAWHPQLAESRRRRR